MQNLTAVIINNVNGKNVVSSRTIAEQLGKEHGKVLRTLDEISEKPNMASLIIPSTYRVEGQNREYKEYLLTKDGFILYMFNIQGFQEFKMAYIQKFNEMEARLKKPLSPAEFLLQQAQLMVEMENRVTEVEKDIKRLENNQRRTITSNQLTIIAYANMKGISPKHYNSSVMGRKATKICKAEGLLIGKVVDSRYGLINTYPEDVLDRIFFE